MAVFAQHPLRPFLDPQRDLGLAACHWRASALAPGSCLGPASAAGSALSPAPQCPYSLHSLHCRCELHLPRSMPHHCERLLAVLRRWSPSQRAPLQKPGKFGATSMAHHQIGLRYLVLVLPRCQGLSCLRADQRPRRRYFHQGAASAAHHGLEAGKSCHPPQLDHPGPRYSAPAIVSRHLLDCPPRDGPPPPSHFRAGDCE